MVEANGASRSLFTKGYKYLFAVLSPANQYLEVAIDLAVEKNGGKGVKIAQAFEQDAFSQDVRRSSSMTNYQKNLTIWQLHWLK